MEKKGKRFTVVLRDENLYKKIKILSVERGIPMGKLIEDTLEAYVNKTRSVEKGLEK